MTEDKKYSQLLSDFFELENAKDARNCYSVFEEIMQHLDCSYLATCIVLDSERNWRRK